MVLPIAELANIQDVTFLKVRSTSDSIYFLLLLKPQACR